jgi:hypothetical protein
MVLEEINTHRHIRIKLWENVLLYISDTKFGFLIPSFCWTKKKKMLKVLNEGKERMEKELNIVKIMKSVRDIKILMKHSMMSPDVRF